MKHKVTAYGACETADLLSQTPSCQWRNWTLTWTLFVRLRRGERRGIVMHELSCHMVEILDILSSLSDSGSSDPVMTAPHWSLWYRDELEIHPCNNKLLLIKAFYTPWR